jgi:hypothetical protein
VPLLIAIRGGMDINQVKEQAAFLQNRVSRQNPLPADADAGTVSNLRAGCHRSAAPI